MSIQYSTSILPGQEYCEENQPIQHVEEHVDSIQKISQLYIGENNAPISTAINERSWSSLCSYLEITDLPYLKSCSQVLCNALKIHWKAIYTKEFKSIPDIVHKNRISLKKLREIEEICRMTPDERDSFIQSEFPLPELFCFKNRTLFVVLGFLCLFTPKTVALINGWHLNTLLTEEGISALLEGVLTIEEAAKMPHYMHLEYIFFLCNGNGLKALKERIITVEEVSQVSESCYYHFNHLFSTNGLIALRNGWITAKKATSVSYRELEKMLSNKGLLMLQKEHLMIQERSAIPT